jgi:hypothetical protein
MVLLAYTGNTQRATPRSYGMSPKKDHEVSRMSEYINRLLYSGSAETLHHVVDVGSGQVSIFLSSYL